MPNTRDWHDHKIRRRMWDHGFTKGQLMTYEPRVLALLDVLCARLAELDGMGSSSLAGEDKQTEHVLGQITDFGAWLDYFTFDVMGDLGFSKSFGLLYDGKCPFLREGDMFLTLLQMVLDTTPKPSGVGFDCETSSQMCHGCLRLHISSQWTRLSRP